MMLRWERMALPEGYEAWRALAEHASESVGCVVHSGRGTWTGYVAPHVAQRLLACELAEFDTLDEARTALEHDITPEIARRRMGVREVF